MSSRVVCGGTIDLSHPKRAERVRGFQPPWRTVFIYACPACGATHRVRASAYVGLRVLPSGRRVPARAVPGTGAIRCNRHLGQDKNTAWLAYCACGQAQRGPRHGVVQAWADAHVANGCEGCDHVVWVGWDPNVEPPRWPDEPVDQTDEHDLRMRELHNA